MTWPVTPLESIHVDPTALKNAQRQLQLAFQTLQMVLSQLGPEIVQQVVNAVLKALGLGALVPGADNILTNINIMGGQLQAGLQNALRGLLPAVLDNFDGTGSPLTGVINNLDGTATFLAQLGTSSVNTLVDNLDGTVMSVAKALQNLGQPSGTHPYAVGSWQSLLSQTGVSGAGQLASALTGLIPAALDNFDGTATNLGKQIVIGLDGTAQLLTQLGTSPLQTLIDSADGTAMSMAKMLQNGANFFGPLGQAAKNWQTLTTQTGVSSVNQLVTALNGVLPAALDNLDGTATKLGQQIVYNVDGTATYFVTQVGESVNSLIDNLDGTAMSFTKAIAGGFSNTLNGLFNAFSGTPVATAIVAPQIQQAQVTAAGLALQQRLATIGNGGEEFFDIEFSSYTDGALPAQFSPVTGFSTGSAFTISGGLLTLNSINSEQYIYYNAGAMLSDYVSVTGRWQTFTDPGTGVRAGLLARINNAVGNLVEARYIGAAGGAGFPGWQLTSLVGGSPVFDLALSETFTPGADYTLVCGDASITNPYKFQVLKNGVPLTITTVFTGDSTQLNQTVYEDKTHTTYINAAGRSFGAHAKSGGSPAGNVQMISLKAQDNAAGLPSVLVATSESTASTTYTDLTTLSDQVAVTIGASGKVAVFLSAHIQNSTAGGVSWMSFATSGTNTQSGDDSLSISCIASAGLGDQITRSGAFLLVGLTPGLTVFKAKYKASSTTTATFSDRRIGVIAL